MVLNAIERMESHASAKEQPCSAVRRGTDAGSSGGVRADAGGGDSRTAPSACVVASTTAVAAAAAAPSRDPCSPSPASGLVGCDVIESSRDDRSSGKSLEQSCSGDKATAALPEESTAPVVDQSGEGATAPPSAAATSSIVDRRVSRRRATTQTAKVAATAVIPVISFGSLGDDDFCDDADGDGGGRAVIGKGQGGPSVPSVTLALNQATEVGPRVAVVDAPAPAADTLPADEVRAAATDVDRGGGSQDGVERHACEDERGSTDTEMGSNEAGREGGITVVGQEGYKEGEGKGRENRKGSSRQERSVAGPDALKVADRCDMKNSAVAEVAATVTTAAVVTCGMAATATAATADVPGSRDRKEDKCRQVDPGVRPSSGTPAVIASGASGATAGPSPMRNDPVPRQIPSRLNPRAAPFRFNPAAACSASATGLDRGGAPSATRTLSAAAPAHATPVPAPTPTRAPARTTTAAPRATAAETARGSNLSPALAGRAILSAAEGEARAVAASDGSEFLLSPPVPPLPPGSSPSTRPPSPPACRTPVTKDLVAAASPRSGKPPSGGGGNDTNSSASSGKTQKQKQRQRQRQKKKMKKALSLKVVDRDDGGPSGNVDSGGGSRVVVGGAPASAPVASAVFLRQNGCSNGVLDGTERTAAQPLRSSLPSLPGTAVSAGPTAAAERPPCTKAKPLNREHSATGKRETVNFASEQTGNGGCGGGGGGDIGYADGQGEVQGTDNDAPRALANQAAASAPAVLLPVRI